MHCDLDLWPFDLKIYRAHPCLMGSLHVKFHDDRCKGKAVLRRKPFSVIYALWPWPLTSKSIGHILASWGVCMWSFMMIGVQEKQLCAGNPNAAGQTDGRTDGQTDMVIPVYPPNFVAGGINKKNVVYVRSVWSMGPHEIASEDNTNEKMWILWRCQNQKMLIV